MTPPRLSEVVSRRVTVLGSTGSIGKSTLAVIAHARRTYGATAYPIDALTAHSNVEMLAAQVREFQPRIAVIGDESRYGELKDALSDVDVEIASGEDAVITSAAQGSEVVMVAIVGAAGLAPALAAVRPGVTIALANKECIVAAGDIFRRAIAESGATLIPVDSEHNAAFQILAHGEEHAIERVTLTASGGPFREWASARMAIATPEQAVAHPNWSMGAKISVDSATLMNKGLELIEAHFLFSQPLERLGVLIHPQSIVHCLVSYTDGSTLAHLSAPDMRTPIAHALAWPRRMSSPSRRLDLLQLQQLTFEIPDPVRFPCLELAQASLRSGGLTPTVLNAANEVAVQAFLSRRIGFLDIARVVEGTLSVDNSCGRSAGSIEDVMAADRHARVLAGEICSHVAA